MCTFTEHSMPKSKNSAKQAANDQFVSKRASKRHRDDSPVDSTTGCTGCGRSNHQVSDSTFQSHSSITKRQMLITALMLTKS
jgi:hypothetical protein